jgi:integrase/recombinase XerD
MTLKQYLLEHYTKGTTKVYLLEINNYLANYPAAPVAVYKDVLHYIGALRSRYSNASTLNRILCSMKAYYDYLCYTNRRDDNPARSVKLRDQRSRDIQLQDLFTPAELEELLYRKERYHGLAARNKVLISLLIYQALTPAEMAAITVSSVNLVTGIITVGKRKLSLKPNQVLLFYEYIQDIRPVLLQATKSDKLLIGIRAAPMQAEDITKHIKRSYKGLYPGRMVNAQTIRQSVIANLLKQGHDISLVQQFAGHNYPSSTERYKQDDVTTLQAAVNKYHPVK